MAVPALVLVALVGAFFAAPRVPAGRSHRAAPGATRAVPIGLVAVHTPRGARRDAPTDRPTPAVGNTLAQDLARGLARGIGPSLELVVGDLDSVESGTAGGARPAGDTARNGPPGELTQGDARGGDTFWPDSSSPVRSAPSNSTTGPTGPAVPRVPGWILTKVNLASGVHQRYYLVARPAIVTAAKMPVLLVLPGRNMTPATIVRASDFLRAVGQAVIVFPAGFANSWNAGYCCGVAHLAGINDVAFIEQVMRNVVATEPGASAGQVFITGFSNGGRMALDMACADPGAFAGVAAVEAVAVSSCLHTDPVPLLEVASTADPILTVSAGAPPKHIAGHVEVTVQALVQHWRAMDGCGDPETTTAYPAMTLTEWGHCRGRGRVAVAIYDGGRHAWPHARRATPAAQTVIWAFFHSTAAASDVDPPA